MLRQLKGVEQAGVKTLRGCRFYAAVCGQFVRCLEIKASLC